MAEVTFAQQINNLSARMGTECKALHKNVGALGSLATDDKTSVVNAINEINGKVGKGTAGDVSYGQYEYATVEDALNALLYKAPAINSFTNSVNTVEMGSTVTTVTLNWTTNKTPKTLMLDAEQLEASSTSKTLTSLSLTSNKTWTLKMTDEKGATATRSTGVTFLNGVYYGVGTVAASGGVTNDFIKGLTKNLAGSKGKTFTVNAAAGQYIYYAVPKRFGTVAFNVGGFDGGFTLLATFQFTNASGYAEDYYVYKSDNAGLGNTTVVCK